MPLFSVVVPVYNTVAYLSRCIESVIFQTFTDIEIILVDDGSTDGSSIICDSYKKKYNQIKVYHKENGGVVSARKVGASYASGKYIACVDGDDYLDSHYFEAFYEAISKTNADLIIGSYIIEHENGKREKIIYESKLLHRDIIEKEVFPQLINSKRGEEFPSHLWGCVLRRELYLECQNAIPNTISLGEDSACIKPFIYRSKSLMLISDCNYIYRINIYSMTKKKKPRDIWGPKIRAEHLAKQIILSEYDFKKQLYRATVHSLFNVVISLFWTDEKYRVVKNKIKNVLSYPTYQIAIKNAEFVFGTKYWMATKILRYRLFFLMKIYSKHLSVS